MKAFVYAHFDSRGGTCAVVADTQEEADAKYLKFFGWDEFKECSGLAAEERWFEADLMEAEPGLIKGFGMDVEQDGDVEVLIESRYCPDSDSFADVGADVGTVKLLVVKAGERPEGFGHPRWDDDAFNFVIVKNPVGILEDAS